MVGLNNKKHSNSHGFSKMEFATYVVETRIEVNSIVTDVHFGLLQVL